MQRVKQIEKLTNFKSLITEELIAEIFSQPLKADKNNFTIYLFTN